MLSMCYVTTPSKAVARQLAQILVKDHRAAACVNILPQVTSVYEWEGKLNEEEECLMLIKTRTALVPRVVELVKSHHPYDCPEVISVALGEGNPAYMQWVVDQTTPQS